MRWIKTFSLVIRSNITALFEHFENPERVLNQLVIDMEEELQRVRENVAGVIADEIVFGKQVDRARTEAREWRERAEKALARGDEAGARTALDHKLRADERAEALDKEYQKHKEDTAKLQRAVRDLEQKIRQARHRRALLVARLARAESARTVNEVMQRAQGTSALAQFHRLEARVERAEAMEQAYDRLDDRDPSAEELQRQFEERERQEKLQKELDELRQRLKGDG